MAFTFIAAENGGASALPDQASITVGTLNPRAAGTFAIIAYAVDNNQTTDGDENAVTSVNDSGGNTWVKAVEFTNGQGAAQAGATCGIWYCNLTAPVAFGGSYTINFSNNTSRDAAAFTLLFFSKGAGSLGVVEGTATLADDASSTVGSLNVTTSNIECIRVRFIAAEAAGFTNITKTAAFTGLANRMQANSGVTATSMSIMGEYLISTGTGQASAPTLSGGAVDSASVYVAFKELSSKAPPPFRRPTRFFTRRF